MINGDVKVEKKEIIGNGIALRLQKIRKYYGLSQSAFADSLGISREGYRKIEKGENNLSLSVMLHLKEVYGVSADYVLFGERTDTEQMWNGLQGCSEITRLELLMRLISYFAEKEGIVLQKEAFSIGGFMKKVMEEEV